MVSTRAHRRHRRGHPAHAGKRVATGQGEGRPRRAHARRAAGRHGGGRRALRRHSHTTARVVVRYNPGDLELEIVDDGLGSGAIDGDGHGLVGMRERVALYGGKIDAGPRDGGFAVTVRLPLESDRA